MFGCTIALSLKSSGKFKQCGACLCLPNHLQLIADNAAELLLLLLLHPLMLYNDGGPGYTHVPFGKQYFAAQH
eukprot:2185172-Pleurochrysis_carterae.AAC.1